MSTGATEKLHHANLYSIGYITEETLKEQLKLVREVHPEVDEVTLKKQNQYTWRNFYNNGQDTPKGMIIL